MSTPLILSRSESLSEYRCVGLLFGTKVCSDRLRCRTGGLERQHEITLSRKRPEKEGSRVRGRFWGGEGHVKVSVFLEVRNPTFLSSTDFL